MRVVNFEVYPYVNENGTLALPDEINAEDEEAVRDYIDEHFDDAVLAEDSHDYCGADIHINGVYEQKEPLGKGLKLISTNVDTEKLRRAEQVLVDNGIDADEAATVLQAIGYTLLDTELYPRSVA